MTRASASLAWSLPLPVHLNMSLSFSFWAIPLLPPLCRPAAERDHSVPTKLIRCVSPDAGSWRVGQDGACARSAPLSSSAKAMRRSALTWSMAFRQRRVCLP
eukprot:91430-Rhodomonas_salina.2